MMYDELKYHLPVFLVFFGIASFYWRSVRTNRMSLKFEINSALWMRLKKANRLFYMIFILICVKVVFYSFFLESYNSVMLPFYSWDIPQINSFGVTILNVSLIWLIVTQMNLDLIIFRILSGKIEKEIFEKVLTYSEKSMLIGYLIMFVGLFVTISSLASLIMAVVGIAGYYFFFLKTSNKNTPHRFVF